MSLCLLFLILSLRIIMISNRQTSKDLDEIDNDNFDLTENTFPTIYSSFIITYSKNPFYSGRKVISLKADCLAIYQI